MKRVLALLLCVLLFMSLLTISVYAETLYTVTFVTEYGTVENQKVEENSCALYIKPTGNTGDHCFRGWLLDGEMYDFTTPVKGNITLIADWKEHTNEKTKSDSCTESQNITLTCSVCEEEYNASLPARGHDLQYVDEVPSTCTNQGTAAHYVCKYANCSALFLDENANTPTTEEALKLQLAKHDTELIPGRESSCIVPGNTAYYKCKVCKGIFNDKEARESSSVLEHSRDLAAHRLILVEELAATCTETGNIAYYKCSECEKLFSAVDPKQEISEDDIITDKLSHTLSHQELLEATCETAGHSEYWQCTSCNRYFSSNTGADNTEISYSDTIILNGHKLTKITGKAATCKERGQKDYWSCSYCKKLFSDENGINEISAPEELPLLAHTWDNGKETREPTCEIEGEKIYTCTVCKEKKSEAIAKTAHKLVRVPAKAATETEDGNIEFYYCSECGSLFSDSKGTYPISEDQTVSRKIMIIKGNGGKAYYGYSYSFTLNANYNTAIKDNIVVYNDSAEISRDYYTVSDGGSNSTVITLSTGYIRRLSPGTYGIAVQTNLGTANGFFKVSSSPKTGDNNDVTLWLTEEIVSLLGMTAITWYLFRRKET